MEIKKLNCIACGAPITIPDDLDVINCSSCGTMLSIQRGEGYIALKAIEKLANVIQEVGRGAEFAIRDGAQVTRNELQKMQLTQEFSMNEMKLTTLQSEIRLLSRQQGTSSVQRQLQELHIQESQVLERQRSLRYQIQSFTCDHPENSAEIIAEQISMIWLSIKSLETAGAKTAPVQNGLNELKRQEQQLQVQLLNIKVNNLRATLSSYKLSGISGQNLEEVNQLRNALQADLYKLQSLPPSQESQIIRNELQSRIQALNGQWTALEDQRIRGILRTSLQEEPALNAGQLQERLHNIDLDLSQLLSSGNSPVVQSYTERLRQLQSKYSKQLKKLQKHSGRESAGMGFLGIGALLAALGLSNRAMKGSSTGADRGKSVALVQSMPAPKHLALGCFFWLVIWVVIFVISFLIFGFVGEGYQDKLALGAFLLCGFGGYGIGAGTFYIYNKKMSASDQPGSNGSSQSWSLKTINILANIFLWLALCIGIYLFMFSISFGMYKVNESIANIFFLISILAGPFGSLVILLVMRLIRVARFTSK